MIVPSLLPPSRRPLRRAGSALAISLGLVAVMGLSRTARAGGFAIPDIGTRKTGMGAVVGRPDDLTAVYHNPAGLTLLPGTHLYVSVGVALPSTNLRLAPFPGSSDYINAPVDSDGYYPRTSPTIAFGAVPMLAVSTNLITNKLWGALSFYVPNAVGAAFASDSPVRYHLVSSYLVSGNLGVSFAYRPLPWLAIGGGLSMIYVQIYGERKLFPVLNGMDLHAYLGGDSSLILTGNDLTWGWNAGVLVQPFSALSIGATVISRTDATLRGDVIVRPGDTAVFSNDIKGQQSTALLLPWTLMVGANLDVSPNVELGAEFRYWPYSEWKSQHTDITGPLSKLLSSLDQPKNYHDSWQVSGGLRVHGPVDSQWHGLEFMAGVHYDKSPAPDNTVSLDQPSFDHVGIHTGVRAPVTRRYVIGLTFGHYVYLERKTMMSLTLPPSNFDASGDINLISLNLEVLLDSDLVLRRYKSPPL